MRRIMNPRIDFRNMKRSQHLEEHVQKELSKLGKFIDSDDTIASVDLTMNTEGIDQQLCRAELRVNNKYGKFVAHEEGRDIYLAISQVVEKLLQELASAKERFVDRRDSPDKNPLRSEKEDFKK